MKHLFTPFEKFVFRTPLFPFQRAGTQAEFDSDTFREAIFLASPELYGGNVSKDAKKQEKFDLSLLKYRHRATTRCTPFGLFAGCSVGTIGDHTRIEPAPVEKYTRCTRLDMQYLCALIQQIERDPAVRGQLTYYPNDSLYPMGGKYRFIEYQYHNSHRLHSVISLEIDEALEQLFATAAGGATMDMLTECLTDEEITREDALAYVNEVVESQVLKSELDPCVVGGDVLDTLVGKLSRLKGVQALGPLRKIQRLLRRIDLSPIGTTQPLYDRIVAIVKELGVGYEAKFLFQTDLFKPVPEAQVDRTVTDRICSLIDYLAKITPSGGNAMAGFAQAFQSRYEEAEVPLTEVLDGELGLGYPASSKGADVSPLLDGLFVPQQQGSVLEVRLSPVDRVLLRKYIEAVRDGKRSVSIEDPSLDKSDNKHRLPETTAVMCSLSGDGAIYVRSIGGIGGANLLGRFCHIDRGIEELVSEVTAFEERRHPGVLYAEISHLPDSRIGNIASRPALREHTLHYLSNCEEREKNIPVTDLMLSVKGGRLFLRSKKHDKEVVPRLTCAHNYSTSPIPIYRFLCDLQHQDKTGGFACNWPGVLAGMDYFPRLEYDGMILQRQRWRVREEEAGQDDFWQSRGIPHEVVIPDADNELYLDLADDRCRRILRAELSKRKEIVLEEFLFDHQTAIVRQGENVYTNEFIFALHQSE